MENETIYFKLLNNKFLLIKNKGWIKGVKYGIGSVGLTLESELGKEFENFEIPDFYGIELKATASFKDTKIALISSVPDGQYLFETKRLMEKYGNTNNLYKRKMLIVDLNCSIKEFAKGYSACLYVDRLNQKIYLNIYDKTLLIDNQTYWDFNTLKEKLIRKNSNLAIVYAQKKTEKNENYFKYNYIKYYRLKSFDDFIKLLEQNKISLNFSLSYTKLKSGGFGIKDHGITFKIKRSNLNLLFDEYLI